MAVDYKCDYKWWQWGFHAVRHPFEGFSDIRWKNGYSMRVTVVIVLLFFLSSVCKSLFTGFVFNTDYTRVWLLAPHISLTIGAFFAWVIGNYAICTLLDGDGRLKSVCCGSAYCLIPYVSATFINVVLSNILVGAENGMMLLISAAGLLWSVLMVVMCVKEIHGYSLLRTVVSCALTVVCVVVILFLAMLVISLFQQIMIFVNSIIIEVSYRM